MIHALPSTNAALKLLELYNIYVCNMCIYIIYI